MRTFKPSSGLARLGAPLIGLTVIAFLSVPAIYWSERSSLAVWARKTEPYASRLAPRQEFHVEGQKTPETTPAAAAVLADEEPVIGIEADGKFRAYRQRAMTVMSRHVFNDVLGGTAVTVTFCDLDDCARAFGGDKASGPLDIDLAGIDEGRMLLSVGDVIYFQKTAENAELTPGKTAIPFPYASFPLKRTTWGEWKMLHPDTDLYVYNPPKTPDPKSAAH